jgi:oligopeptide/dipeptide ABC transporter ATP-binding protein
VTGELSRPVLEVRDLSVRFRENDRETTVVDRLSYELHSGRTLAIIGESGSGKTVSCRALLGLLPQTARIRGGARLNGAELLGISERELRRYRGSGIAMVFQDSARALNPTMRVGHQITEAIREHALLDGPVARERAIELLEMLLVTAPRQRFLAYPHELSGGMRQRVVIAMAVAGNPKVLIADEATRALDVVTQAETLRLLKSLQERMGMALVMISHDLRMAAHVADEVLVMYAGRAVEHAPAAELFRRPRMRYTRALLDAIPRLEQPSRMPFAIVPGHPPDLATLPDGCAFEPRCAHAAPVCKSTRPKLEEHGLGHSWACWRPCEQETG